MPIWLPRLTKIEALMQLVSLGRSLHMAVLGSGQLGQLGRRGQGHRRCETPSGPQQGDPGPDRLAPANSADRASLGVTLTGVLTCNRVMLFASAAGYSHQYGLQIQQLAAMAAQSVLCKLQCLYVIPPFYVGHHSSQHDSLGSSLHWLLLNCCLCGTKACCRQHTDCKAVLGC